MKNSYTDHIKKQSASVKKQVLSIVSWNETEFAEFQEKVGKQYLQSYISTDPEGIDMLVKSRIYWNWWKNQWLIRDTSYVSSNVRRLSHRQAFNIYMGLHDADILIQSIYPAGAILDHTYAQMIGEVIKQTTNGLISYK